MEGCAIEFIDFGYTGNSDHSNWEVNIMEFEYLIHAISKCIPLTKSPKKLNIEDSGVDLNTAKAFLSKYNLDSIKIEGI